MKISVNIINSRGIQYQPRRGSRYPARHITDDIALLSDSLDNAQALLSALEWQQIALPIWRIYNRE